MTSPIREIAFQCPHCWHVYQAEHRPSINLDLDPQLDDPDYFERMSAATCPECGRKVELDMLVVRGHGRVWEVKG